MGSLRPLRQLCFLLRLDFHRVRELPAISTVELLRPVDVSYRLQSRKGTSTYWPEATGFIKMLNLVSRDQPVRKHSSDTRKSRPTGMGETLPSPVLVLSEVY